MIEFNNNNIDFLNKKLDFLKQKLADFEVAYLQVALELVDDKYSSEITNTYLTDIFYIRCGEGAKIIKAHINLIKSCIDLTKLKIKEVGNENNRF